VTRKSVISAGYLVVLLFKMVVTGSSFRRGGGGACKVNWEGKSPGGKPFIKCQHIRLGTTVDDILK
jgi:hypothetical protein